MPLRIMFVGESPQHSAPTLTATRALIERTGCDVMFSEAREFGDTWQWYKLLKTRDAVIVVLYGAPSRFLRRQLALAALLRKPVIRWWVGSDVLNLLHDARIRRAALAFNRVVTVNIAVAPHLRDELATVGIPATVIPSLLDPSPASASPNSRPPNSLLVYLPSSRRDFYGFDIVREAVTQNPDVAFIVVADDTHSLARYPNVTSLGWVDDMSAVWETVGGLLRVTSHDGLPRMVLDALRREKHVIYSWPLPGCRLARTLPQVLAAIGEFKVCEGGNRVGAEAAKTLLEPDPAIRFAQRIQSELASPNLFPWCRAAWIIAADTVRMKLRLGPHHSSA
jgi:hypothetical protein